MKTLALRARVFIHCFLVFRNPGETLALVVHILHEQRERVFHRDIQTRENNVHENTSAKRSSVFMHSAVFECSVEYPGETRARVVYMASQMNRDVTECFRLLI
jgi:hypothetical protein